jgi:hypothetical protein
MPKLQETKAGSASTMLSLNKSPEQGGLGWNTHTLVQARLFLCKALLGSYARSMAFLTENSQVSFGGFKNFRLMFSKSINPTNSKKTFLCRFKACQQRPNLEEEA